MDLYEEYGRFLDSCPEYLDEIVSIAIRGDRSFYVEWPRLYEFNAELASSLLEDPVDHLKGFCAALHEKYRLHAAEQVVPGDLHIRIKSHPNPLSLREITYGQVGKLISFNGIALNVSPVQPFIEEAAYVCDCGAVTIVNQRGQFLLELRKCGECEGRSLILDPTRSRFSDIQYLGVQEMPEHLPPNQLPINLVVELKHDLCGSIVPGDRIKANGILHAKRQSERNLTRVLDAYVETNYIEAVSRDLEAMLIKPEEEAEIKRLAEDPWIYSKVIQSIAPGIYGMEPVKEAVALQLFGGVTKQREGIRLRGDIHILLVGDPGTGKSHILQYATQASPRGLYTMGRGSTAAGLTAAVIKNPQGSFTLEAGAMVLVDMGLCCIDELEKMREEDRGAIHPAMEQQVISITKGGIIAELNTRCSVLAAANPTLGRYNSYQNIAENISNLPVTLLNRFDLIFIVRDIPEKTKDEKITNHVLTIHRNEPNIGKSIPLELMRKYVCHARKIKPELTEEAADHLKSFYLEMRNIFQALGEGAPIAITVRQLEALVRLAEARARLHLREKVTVEDAGAAINLMQRSLEQVGVDVTTGRMDIDTIMTGKPRSLQEKLQTLLHLIDQLSKRDGAGAQREEIYRTLNDDYKITERETAKLIDVLMKEGLIFCPRIERYRRV